MNKLFLLPFIGLTSFVFSQTYAPAAGENGSTAVAFDSPNIVAWATSVEVTRGYINIEDTTATYQGNNKANFGTVENAIGPANNISTSSISLGDSGIAIVTFNRPITNGTGFDFAVFENGVTDNFLELAHVEVSSDGVHYVRFPSHSLTQTQSPVGSFGAIDPTNIYNLAGKYRVGYGTPFDLEELKDSLNLDVEKITHVKIIDAVGSLGAHGTVDSYGNKINDPFPTLFHTGGFDLNGIGVINEYNNVGLQVEHLGFSVYPNPSSGTVHISTNNMEVNRITVVNVTGEIVKEFTATELHESLQIQLTQGVYLIQIKSKQGFAHQKIIIQ